MNKISLQSLMSGFGLFVMSACNQVDFTPASESYLSQVNHPCSVGTVENREIRILFMIDDSGSTLTTDPSHTYRVQTLQKFIQDYGSNRNLSYNFGYFSGTTARMYDGVSDSFIQGVAPNPNLDSAALTDALNAYSALTSAGNTPYKAAFKSMSDTIKADELAGNKQDYAVVFMSDGQPTDITGAANLNALVSDLKAVAGANGSDLTLSTVYFGPSSDSRSIANLTGMAAVANGQFVDTNQLSKGGLVINDIINVPGSCQ